MTEFLIAFNDEWVPSHTVKEQREKSKAVGVGGRSCHEAAAKASPAHRHNMHVRSPGCGLIMAQIDSFCVPQLADTGCLEADHIGGSACVLHDLLHHSA